MGNYVRDFVARQPAGTRALVVRGPDGARREWTFAELVDAAARTATGLERAGVGRGDMVLTLLDSGIEFALVTLACLHLGAVMMPCSQQLRAKDVALRIGRCRPALIVTDPSCRHLVEATGVPVRVTPDPDLFESTGPVPDHAELAHTDPAFVLFTSGTTTEPKLVTHAQRYVWGQRLQAQHWLGARPGELVWSTAAPGWSKSTRNSFIAPWFCGAAAVLESGRFDPEARLATVRAEQVNVLCMAPTEYRLIAAHGPIADVGSLRRLVAAGEALGAPTIDSWREQTGVTIADGYGQTETGHLTAVRPGDAAPAGSMGRPLPGVVVEIIDGALCVEPSSVPTFFLGYDHAPVPDGRWHTGDHVDVDEQGWLFFRSRTDDVIISAGYRIGPAEVESILLAHPSVSEVAVIGTPDQARGEVVTAIVVLRAGRTGDQPLAGELQELVRNETAPYKYPRVVRFVEVLPKTTSGKINRAQLRRDWTG